MTYLIDISGHQAALDIEVVKPDNEAVIVKAVASYLPGLTVAEAYQSNIDRVAAAGLPKGHYLVPNGANAPEPSAVFMAENLHQYSGGDVLALDNEPLDAYGVYWRDADCAKFFRALHAELGHPYERMWLYCPAYLTRKNGPWTETLALGVKVWWVSYGDNDPLLEDGEEPLLGGGVTHWDVHQFTSTYRVSGYAGNLDRNFTPHPVSDLFGGVDVGYLEARPAKGNMNQGFGPRPRPTPTSPAIHYGQDYGWGGGDAIYAARGGRVLSYASSGAYGNRLIIDHGNGRQTWYCHLASALVGVGANVAAGQQIAWMGATGNVTAKHLHFELRINGVATDPEPYFATSSTAGGTTTTPIGEDIVALSDAVDLFYNQHRGYIVVGPGFVYKVGDSDGLSGNQKLGALGAVGITPRTVEVGVWDALNIIFLGNQAAVDNAKYTASLVESGLSDAQVDQLANSIAARIPQTDGSGGPTAEAIAAAVRAEFASNPLK